MPESIPVIWIKLLKRAMEVFTTPSQFEIFLNGCEMILKKKYGREGIVIEKGQVKYFTSEISVPANGSCDETIIQEKV